MKKIYLLLLLIGVSSSLFAESSFDQRADGVMTKSGLYILPAKGDFALGVSASPFLNYFGNIFNNSTENTHANNIFSNNGNLIRGKYFLADNKAIRADFGFSFGSLKESELVTSTADSKLQVTDITKTSEKQFSLTLGYEMRRGYGRLQGYAGPALGVGVKNASQRFTYGNNLGKGESRTVRLTEPSTTSFNLGGFLGVEYFIAPKIAVGGEVNLFWAIKSSGKGAQYEEVSKYVQTDYMTFQETYHGKQSESQSFFGTKTSAQLMVHFYF